MSLKRFSICNDLDGVAVDFHNHYRAHAGVGFNDIPQEEAWRILKSIPDFWLNCPPMPDWHELWEFVKPYNPIFLTSPSRHDTARAMEQKKLWVEKYMGSYAVFFRRARHKHHLAAPDTILIDDFKPTIKRWRDAGGIAIHHKSAAQTIAELKEIAERPIVSDNPECLHYARP